MDKKKIHVDSVTSQYYLETAQASSEELLSKFSTSMTGLNEEQVPLMARQYGRNEITKGRKDTLLRKLIKSFANPFTVVLFIIAGVSYGTDVIFASPEERNYSTVIIIVAMVVLSGLFRFVQEVRSSNEAEKLKAMVKVTALVRRAGKEVELPLSALVVGDIVHLAAGDMIPADLRMVSVKDLFISQSALTGESEPLEKTVTLKESGVANYLECSNLAFLGSNVMSGSAVGLVISVGDQTVFGSMATSIIDDGGRETNFNKGISSVSWLLVRFMCVMVPIVLLVNGFTKGNWIEATLFALSVAVGLTPEMLPMIVTTNLAKGAVQLGRKKTIVKDLNSIQNLGAIDVLCTDKTGTLTQDKVVLEFHLDAQGKSSEDVLRYAFLNSYYQTGLKNLMDLAVLNHVGDEGIVGITDQYKKIDEIPFDFNRRRMSVVIQGEDEKPLLITKGAVEETLATCAFVELNGARVPLTTDHKIEVLDTVEGLNKQGMRVVAVTQKSDLTKTKDFCVKDEFDMTLIGYLAFLDPPKESASAAIAALKDLGVAVKILTGDNDAVTGSVCQKVGLGSESIVLGSAIELLNDQELAEMAKEKSVFAKVSPQQKARIVRVLRESGSVVGLMGDGINDAAAMKASDVGISVDTAVDIAKESADIILLEKDLMVLATGIRIGRITYANIVKYIKMSVSSNFGNMFSVLVASAFLPFLPMLPIQLIFLNLLSDFFCVSIPWDNVDEEFLKKPKKWDASSIGKFMVWIGPTSSIFDVTTYGLMFFIICPLVIGSNYANTGGESGAAFASLFQTGWFVESLVTQTLVVHMIRTAKIPFIESRASAIVLFATTIIIMIGIGLPYTVFGKGLGMVPLPWQYFPWLLATIGGYMIVVTWVKKRYIARYGQLL